MSTNSPSSTPVPPAGQLRSGPPLRLDNDEILAGLSSRQSVNGDIFAIADSAAKSTRALMRPPASDNPDDIAGSGEMREFDPNCLLYDPDDADYPYQNPPSAEKPVATIVPTGVEDDPDDICSETRPTDPVGLANKDVNQPVNPQEAGAPMAGASVAGLDWDDETIVDPNILARIRAREGYNDDEK